jgi:hypothetical protein
MSNEVAVVHGHLIPEYLRGRATEPIKSDLGKTGGPPRIAIMKDGFKIMQDGREVKLPAPLPVIILGASPAGEFYNRAYYARPYQPGSLEPPDCASSDGIIPDSGELKQATTCIQCPWSQWGSAPGGKGQACAQGKTLLVVPATAPTGAVFQLRVPPTSLKPVAAYGAEIAAYGVPISAVITNLGIELEGDTQYQKLTLSMGGFLQEDAGPVAIARAESAEIRSLVTVVDPGKQIAAAQASVQQPPAQPAQPDPQAAGWGAPPVQEPPQSTEWGAPPPQQPPVQQPPVQQPPVQQPPVQQPPVQQPPPQAPPVQQAPPQQPDLNVELDSAGEPWDPEKHSSGKTKIKDGTWKKKKGYKPPAEQTQQAPPQTQQAPPQQAGGLDDILAQWG